MILHMVLKNLKVMLTAIKHKFASNLHKKVLAKMVTSVTMLMENKKSDNHNFLIRVSHSRFHKARFKGVNYNPLREHI